MHDAGGRRHHPEVGERRLPPVQELVALAVAAELNRGVAGERVAGAEVVYLHRVVDHQVHRHLRIDPGRVAAEARHRGAHRAQIDDRRHAGEVLHHHPRGAERQARPGRGLRLPARQLQHLLGADGSAAAATQQRLQQDAQRVRQRRKLRSAVRFQGGQAEETVVGAADAQPGPRT